MASENMAKRRRRNVLHEGIKPTTPFKHGANMSQPKLNFKQSEQKVFIIA